MRALNWLKRLYSSERGNVLLIGAATMPLLMGSAGLAVDAIQLTLWKRQLQRAADSASIAGARAIAQGAVTTSAVDNDLDEHIDYDLEENETPLITNQTATPGSFAAGTISSQTCAARAVDPCYDRAVEVSLTSERRLPFMSIFTNSSTTLRVKATAAVVADGQFCLVSLYDGTDSGFISGGNSDLDLSCGIATNSRASNAMSVKGSATINADPAAAVGGITGGDHFGEGTTLQPYSAPVADPFAHVPDPVLPSNCNSGTLKITGGTAAAPTTIPDGACYAGYDIDGFAKIADGGKIYLNNGLLDLKGSLTGTNVTLIMMGDDSTWKQNGGGKMHLTAPETGVYKGIVVFRDRYAANKSKKEISLNGGADMFLQGAIYGKSTDFWIGGNADIDSECIQVVGRKLEFKGGGSIKNDCSGLGYGSFDNPTIRLVG